MCRRSEHEGKLKPTPSFPHLTSHWWSALAIFSVSPRRVGLTRRDLLLEARETHPVSIRPPGSWSGCGDHREAARDVSSPRGSTASSEASREWGRGDLLPVGFTPCSNLQGDYSFFHHCFIYSISKFISNSPGGKQKYRAECTHTLSERADNDGGSSCE